MGSGDTTRRRLFGRALGLIRDRFDELDKRDNREAPERLPWQVEQIAALSDIVVAQLSLGNLGDVAERVRQLQGMLADIDLEFVGFGTGTCEHSNYSPTGACLARPPCPPAS